MARLLVVEDDPGIRSALIHALSDRGHAVDSAPSAMQGLQQAISGDPELVVLDLGLPDLDGVELLRMLRAVSRTPVVVATARDDEEQVVRALDAGADDYVIKPFSATTLEARIRAVLRRTQASGPSSALAVGDLHLDTKGRTASLAGEPLELSPREFDLLAYLMARPGEVVTKRELLAEVWRVSYAGGEKTVDVHLSWLRRKLGETAQEPRFLHTVRGVGVKLLEPEQTRPAEAIATE
jgi:two-component system, OmpR family, KDP operon response regulator KdpE